MSASLYDSVEPRADVLAGTLADSVFAASLDEVVAGTAPAAYGDSTAFFAGTYPSTGLRTLLGEVFGRLSGAQPDAPPVIRLETNLGGGKTHNLIAAYHVARGGLAGPDANEYLDPSLLPATPVRVGVLVGTAVGATSFPTNHGVSPRTPWGHLALALGGPEAYAYIQADDEARTAPGSGALGRAIGDGPALVLIDELAAYLARAGGVQVGATTLATQTIAFLMSLIEAVAAKPRATLVLTSTQVTDAFGDQTGSVLAAMSEAESLIARKEHVLRPSDEADLPKILARRLFAELDRGAPSEVAAAYADVAEETIAAGIDLPDGFGSGWAQAVAGAYPFHPDLITVLDKRLSTIPNFQRTRGALRLLARTVRNLWDTRPPTSLIHLHHVDLANRDSVEDLSSRLERPGFEPVIRADIASATGGEPSHAEEVDRRMAAAAPYARRLATTAYLWSLTREVPGVPAGTLIGSVAAPGDDPNVISKALDELEARAWYLSIDVRGYRFSTEASLPKLIQEAESQIAPSRVRDAATDILARQFKDSVLSVRRSWEDAKIPDRADAAWLVILHWDEFGSTHGVTSPTEVPRPVTELWEKKPDGGIRDFRNRLVFLVPSAASHEAMTRAVRHHLGLAALLGHAETLRGLPADKARQLDAMSKESELEARVAVCNHVNVLFVPGTAGLEGLELDTVTTASVKPNQTGAIAERLASLDKTLAAGDRPLDPAMIAARLGAQLDRPMATAELVRTFARLTYLRMVLDTAQLTALILAGVRNGVWEYNDPARGEAGWATRAAPAAAVRIAEDTFIHPMGSAPAAEPEEIPHLAPPRPMPTSDGFAAAGKTDVALTKARDDATEAGAQAVCALAIRIDEAGAGTGVELAKLLSVVPPGTAGVALRYDIEARVDLGVAGDSLAVRFVGPATGYGPLRSALDGVLRAHEAVVRASVTATFVPPVALGGQEVEDIARRATDTGPAKASLTMSTEEPT